MSVLTVPMAETGPASITRRTRVLRRLRRNPLAVVSFVVLAVAAVIALLSPWIAPYSVEQTDFAHTFSPPGTPGHMLGTDDLGRDVLSRIMLGARASLQVALLAVATSLAIGVPLGLAAGYFRVWDAVISRFTDLLLAFPFLIMAVGLAAIRGASLGNAAVAIGVAQIPGVIRVVRSDTLRLKSLDFVAAAVVDGASDLWVLARHIMPNATSVILVQATVAIPAAILGEAVLSFLGLGIQPPAPSLGTMLATAQQFAARAPWAAVLPGVVIMGLALAFNVFGDALRDALDPKGDR
ncbi:MULTISPECIES: ABC transporter permease [Micromonospora]|uniref:Peptide/nickel transport system permease protein n=1 Tax=Micromonospora echinaurantiaca TaxID=47857 RepID=A0A1C5I8K7_9ACTN|nr:MULTISPECIES: ABC transporter permease [Micromonospora]PWU56058.1 ABC transporter permease [Micromonospora sp. S4605]SCG54495.1 peptide/nickel transport system permease protein [Micromonospora echinaurantiaca]